MKRKVVLAGVAAAAMLAVGVMVGPSATASAPGAPAISYAPSQAQLSAALSKAAQFIYRGINDRSINPKNHPYGVVGTVKTKAGTYAAPSFLSGVWWVPANQPGSFCIEGAWKDKTGKTNSMMAYYNYANIGTLLTPRAGSCM